MVDWMYCPECGKFFREKEVVWNEIGESMGAPATWESKCPFCGADDPEQASECEVCGEPIKDGYLCGDCKSAIKSKLGVFYKKLAVEWQLPEQKIKEAVLDYITEVE